MGISFHVLRASSDRFVGNGGTMPTPRFSNRQRSALRYCPSCINKNRPLKRRAPPHIWNASHVLEKWKPFLCLERFLGFIGRDVAKEKGTMEYFQISSANDSLWKNDTKMQGTSPDEQEIMKPVCKDWESCFLTLILLVYNTLYFS